MNLRIFKHIHNEWTFMWQDFWGLFIYDNEHIALEIFLDIKTQYLLQHLFSEWKKYFKMMPVYKKMAPQKICIFQQENFAAFTRTLLASDLN